MNYDSRPDTELHIARVRHFLGLCLDDLYDRSESHDKSKLESPEKEYFDIATPKLKDLKYGTPEYKASTEELKPALEHHYKHNDHHPQYHGEEGINGMNLLSLIEMLCDWRASTERGKEGDIRKSLEINAQRFGISKQLNKILLNTINYLNL